jgi:mannose-1-phosphate guanylyltransferase
LSQRISGDSRPKQFCRFFGGKSLLSHTRDRIAPMFRDDRILFALAGSHEQFYREELEGVDDKRRVVQPSNRGTAVAMAVCLQRIVQQDEDAIVAFFPSDHHYSDGAAFRRGIESGFLTMEEYPESVLLLGAQARYPEVEYGWIQPGRTLVDSCTHPLYRVARFWEKPAPDRAEELRQKGCLWNTFVMVGLAAAFLELLQATVPGLLQSLDRGSDVQLDQLYDGIAPIDFSRSVLARMPERLIVQRDAASGWTDFGSPARVVDVLSRQSTRPEWLVSSHNGPEIPILSPATPAYGPINHAGT